MDKKPKVNEINEFLEIASDFEDPLEVIREALSNSYDANATEVKIEIKKQDGKNTLIIEDNGDGMDEKELESFFDLGNSYKQDSIGYKGHGTKIYYKSEQVKVETIQEGKKIQATMENPWKKLNNKKLPRYSIDKIDTDNQSKTHIEIKGFKVGKGFNPDKLSYKKIHNYIKWKTVGGSTEHYFTDDFHEMNITVELDPEIDNSREKLKTNNKLEFPEENLNPEGQFVAEEMCKKYPPREIEVETENKEFTIQVVGMIAGKKVRNKLPTYGRHSSQFGLWLAKDHIKIERLNDVITSDNEFFYFFFIANCQEFELSSNREKIRNKSGEVFEAIKDELKHFMIKASQDKWYREYVKQRSIENKLQQKKSQKHSIENRRKKIEQREKFKPENPSELVAILERYNANGAKEPVRIADFKPNEEINAIVEYNSHYENTSLQVKLSDFFKKEATIEHIDRFICWKIGDMDYLREIERDTYLNKNIEFNFSDRKIRYGENLENSIPIIELSNKTSI